MHGVVQNHVMDIFVEGLHWNRKNFSHNFLKRGNNILYLDASCKLQRNFNIIKTEIKQGGPLKVLFRFSIKLLRFSQTWNFFQLFFAHSSQRMIAITRKVYCIGMSICHCQNSKDLINSIKKSSKRIHYILFPLTE